jgi:hypothetical protein
MKIETRTTVDRPFGSNAGDVTLVTRSKSTLNKRLLRRLHNLEDKRKRRAIKTADYRTECQKLAKSIVRFAVKYNIPDVLPEPPEEIEQSA